MVYIRSYSIVKNIADQAKTGPATVVLSGISEGMRSAAFSVVVVVVGVGGAYTSGAWALGEAGGIYGCLLYTSPSPRDLSTSRMPSSA